jgi:putative drug exporter of the RND superfamily
MTMRPVGRLWRIGHGCARAPWAVLAAWLVLVVALAVLAKSQGGTFNDNVELPGTKAYQGLQQLERHERTAGGHTGLIVMHVPSGTLQDHSSQVESALHSVSGLDHVVSVSDPLAKGSTSLAPGGQIGYATVHFNVQPRTLGDHYRDELRNAMAPVSGAGVQVEYGGGLDALFRPSANDGLSEVIGFAVALVVLLVGFGSVAAAILPLGAALVAVIAGIGILALIANALTFGTTAPTLALMIGLGVGIDYALFQTTRFRQRIMDGEDPVDAAGMTVATAGHAVLIAAATVSLALLGLYVSGVTFIGRLGLAAVFAVITAALSSITLVPALFGLLGRNIDRFTVKEPVAETGSDSDSWHRYAHRVAAHPWHYLIAGVSILIVLAIPLLSINLGHIDDGADPHSYTDRNAYELIAKGFGPGANGQFTIVIAKPGSASQASKLATTVQSELAATPGVAKATPLKPSSDGALLVGNVIPTTSPQAVATRTLYDRITEQTLPAALHGTQASGYVTGLTASQIEFGDRVTSRLPIVIATVIALEFLLLMATFRSVLVALKAAIMNVLSIGAAYGVIVAVFQWGWGSSLLGVSEKVPIESYVPVLMFAIVFGLSMDYEVFLLSHIKEAWDRTGDNTAAVGQGLTSTARVITCAALIMASVFIAFVLSSNVVVKMLAVGLSASVLVDATVVRLILVPSTMTLLGKSNWWLPAWLDRILPRIDAEGSVPEPEVAAVETGVA